MTDESQVVSVDLHDAECMLRDIILTFAEEGVDPALTRVVFAMGLIRMAVDEEPSPVAEQAAIQDLLAFCTTLHVGRVH